MLLELKLRIGVITLISGGLLATAGEIFNLWHNDPTTGGWFLSMGIVVVAMMLLTHGVNSYAQLSETMNLFGVIGSWFLSVGGLLTVAGIIGVNALVLPLLLGIGGAIAGVMHFASGPAQNGINGAFSGLNQLKDNILNLFGKHGNTPDAPQVHMGSVNNLDVVNQVLATLHLPSFTTISQWGHLFFTGGLLSVGCLILGLSLLRDEAIPRTTSYALIAAAILHLIGQFCALFLPSIATFTGGVFFLALAWFGVSVMRSFF